MIRTVKEQLLSPFPHLPSFPPSLFLSLLSSFPCPTLHFLLPPSSLVCSHTEFGCSALVASASVEGRRQESSGRACSPCQGGLSPGGPVLQSKAPGRSGTHASPGTCAPQPWAPVGLAKCREAGWRLAAGTRAVVGFRLQAEIPLPEPLCAATTRFCQGPGQVPRPLSVSCDPKSKEQGVPHLEVSAQKPIEPRGGQCAQRAGTAHLTSSPSSAARWASPSRAPHTGGPGACFTPGVSHTACSPGLPVSEPQSQTRGLWGTAAL